MSNFLLLGVCLIIGVLLKATRRLPKDAPQVLNGFIFYVSLPALVLSQFHDLSFNREAILPMLSAWLLFILAAGVLVQYGRWKKLDQKTLGALILTAGLGNTAFVGFPLIEALYGHGGIKTGMLVDQFGTFPTVSILGIICASYYAARDVSAKKLAARIFAFPPMFALLLAFCTQTLHYPEQVMSVLIRLGETLTPIALVSVGFQLKLEARTLRKYAHSLLIGLFFKLFLGPLVLAILFLGVLHQRGEVAQITVLEMAMAPMITAAIVASEYELNSELANLMVGVGIPLSLFTVPLWSLFLRHF